MRPVSRSQLSLDKAFLGFMALGALVFFGVTIFFVNDRVARLQDEILRSVVETRGLHVALDIETHLEGHWTDLEDLAVALPFNDRATFRSLLTREVAGGEHLTWAAYLGLEGEVLLASRQQGEGETVADRDWFIQALRGPFIGFTQDESGRELLIMTTPVRSSTGDIAGYLTFHFRPDWFEARLAQIVRSLSIDAVVFDDRGRPVFHSFDWDPADMLQISVRNALAGQSSTALESWTSLGERYVMSIPHFPVSTMPTGGWRLVVLTTPHQFDAETDNLRVALAQILGVVAVVLLLMSIAFIRIFLTPLHRLVVNAHEIAEGKEVLPAESRRTTELSLLSSAIAQLQGRALHAEDKVAELEARAGAGPSDDRD